MKLLRISVPLVSTLLFACGGGVEDPGPCTPGRTCPMACPPSQECSDGATCQNGYCAQAAPTAATYASCALDADCPRGDYCSLGACAHDCVLDRDCTSGLVCSSRGRCIKVEQISQPAPVEEPQPGSAAGLEVSPTALDFGHSQVKQSLQLANSQGSPLTYRVLSSRPWVTVEPATGTVSGVSQALTVSVDRTLAGADTHATLSVNSTSGNAKIEVFIGRDLTGHYAGTVRITQPYELATSTLQVNLFQSADGATLTGYVDPDRSLLFPYKSAVSGTITGDDVTLSLVVAGAKGSLANPHYPVPIQRTVTFAGKVTGSGIIAGTVTDSMSGPLESPIVLSGTFQLKRTGAAVEGSAETTPQLPPVTVPNPFDDSRYETCKTQCPTPGSCGNEIAWGDTYLALAANFYKAFQDAAGSADPTNPNTYPFYSVIEGICKEKGGCLDQQDLWCAQYHYVQALSNSGTRSDASVHLLDTLEVLADYAILAGNNQMVQAMDAWKQSGTTLAGEVLILQTAGSYFTVGNHSDNTLPQAMLDPYYLRLVVGSTFDPTTLASNLSNLASLLKDYSEGRAAYEHLRRQALAIGGSLRAALETAERQHRLGDLNGSLATARKGAMQAYIDLALLARVLVASGATPAAFPDATAILRDFEQLSRRFDQVNEGRNPAGYLDGFVPLLAKPNDTGTNFQQIWNTAAGYYTGLAQGQAAAARAATREYEAQGNTLSTQVQSQQTELQKQIISLCGDTSFSGTVNLSFCDVAVCARTDALGRADFSQCGKPGSEMKRAVSDFQAAMDRLGQAQTRIANLAKEIVIERDRALQVSGIHTAQANLILENGKKIISIDQQIREIDESSSFFGGLISFFAGIATIPMGGAGAVTSGLATLAGVGGDVAKGPLEDQRTWILTTQAAQVEFNVANETLVNSAALIKTKLLECATLELDRLIAAEGLSQAADTLLGLSRRSNLLQAQYNRLDFQSGLELNRLLQFRVYADNLTLQAQESQRVLTRLAFLATRAYEYELNVSYGATGNLWTSRSADDVSAYLQTLSLAYQQNPGQPQVNIDVISVRDDLLEMSGTVTDQVTGQVYTPRERFRRYVADPLNRDADGNLRIPFSTYRPDKQIFSRAVCSDRIQKVRVNLIGDNLGAGLSSAYVKLLQDGIIYLRQCGGTHDLTSYDLSGDRRESGDSSSQVTTGFSAPRVARIQAGINAASGATTMVDNTDLAWRGILSGQWELVIDQRSEIEPQNQGLNLAGLDDIEITFIHDAYTIQQ